MAAWTGSTTNILETLSGQTTINQHSWNLDLKLCNIAILYCTRLECTRENWELTGPILSIYTGNTFHIILKRELFLF